jgi:WD40 repeat protein
MIWDIAAGACIQLLKGDSGPIVWVTISPNGRWLASLCRTPWPEANSIVNIWDVGTGACRQTLSVDPAISILALVSNTCIRTNTGTINLDLDSYLDTPISKMSEALLATEDIEVHNQEYGIHASKKWITWKDQRVMWLPPKYRPILSAIGGTTIAIVYGHSSESVLVFKFSTNNPIV